MFAHGLAVLLGLSSFIFYMAAFFYPEVHRRVDFWLSGLGMVCAVVLWFCAGQMTGLVLLAQLLLIVLLAALGWQTLSIRREKTPVYQQTPVVLTPEVVGSWAKNKINQLRIAPDANVRPVRPQNPSLNATSAGRFRQTLDPRRRPVYDYEFIEDGVASEAADEIEPVSESLLADSPVDIDGVLNEIPGDVIPPSAEAEVIIAIAPPPNSSDPGPEDQSKSDDKATESASLEPNSLKTDSLVKPIETEPIETEPIETEPIEIELPETEEPSRTKGLLKTEKPLEIAEPLEITESLDIEDSLETDRSEIDFIDEATSEIATSEADDDWGLETEDSWANVPMDTSALEKSLTKNVEISQPPSQQALSKEDSSQKDYSQKPSALAIPIILLGWVKDVVLSFTRPKPSKPIIEIPRRNIAEKPVEPATVSTVEPTAGPTADLAADSTGKSVERPPLDPEAPSAEAVASANESVAINDTDFVDDDDWEESNWDD